MNFEKVQFVLTDIEGTTTSVDFVYKTLFPFFLKNMDQLKEMAEMKVVQDNFQEVRVLAQKEGKAIQSIDEIIQQLLEWSLEDKKITPLKQLQGVWWR